MRNLREPTWKALKTEVKQGVTSKETPDEAKERFERQTELKLNAKKQISALLSFKEALSTGKPLAGSGSHLDCLLYYRYEVMFFSLNKTMKVLSNIILFIDNNLPY